MLFIFHVYSLFFEINRLHNSHFTIAINYVFNWERFLNFSCTKTMIKYVFIFTFFFLFVSADYLPEEIGRGRNYSPFKRNVIHIYATLKQVPRKPHKSQSFELETYTGRNVSNPNPMHFNLKPTQIQLFKPGAEIKEN